jgi:small Trp-rich protein
MAFVVIGLILLALKVLEIGPFASWSWWVVLAPFGLAALWWSVSDALGLTQKRAMRKAGERTTERRAKAVRDLGLGPDRARKTGAMPRGDNGNGRGGPR